MPERELKNRKSFKKREKEHDKVLARYKNEALKQIKSEEGTLDNYLKKKELDKRVLLQKQRYGVLKQDFIILENNYKPEDICLLIEAAEKDELVLLTPLHNDPRAKWQVLTAEHVISIRKNSPNQIILFPGTSLAFGSSICDLYVSKNQADRFLKNKHSDRKESVIQRHYKEIGRTGGSRCKKDPNLLDLVEHVIYKEKNGWSSFIRMLEENYDSTNPYEGTENCCDIYLDGKALCYTIFPDKCKLSTSISIFTLKKYFSHIKTRTKNK